MKHLPNFVFWLSLCATSTLVGPTSALGNAEGEWTRSPDAIQNPYPNGVPHTDAQGRPRTVFEPAVSFFPIGLYHGLTGTFGGIEYSLGPIAAAGFNTVVGWGDVPTQTLLTAADEFGLQVIISLPRDEEVIQARDHDRVLGFDIDHEPSVAKTLAKVLQRLDAFEVRRSEIRELDPDRAVFTVDYPTIHDSRLAGWETWRRAGDVTSFWNYPIAGNERPSVGGPFGVGDTVARAVAAAHAEKPIWFVAQAFEGPVFQFDWRMPTPQQARAMSYAALVSGATGLIWFSYDSFVTRNGNVIGISPEPRTAYEVALDGALSGNAPLAADVTQLEASRELWDGVADLNREFADQRELWLSPTADLDYEVEIRGARTSRAPVLTQLKQTRDGLYLIVVNVDDNPIEFRISAEIPFDALDAAEGAGTIKLSKGRLVGAIEGFDAIVLKVTLADR